jgi:ribosome-binding protein aMBF1 (putative translation factor)
MKCNNKVRKPSMRSQASCKLAVESNTKAHNFSGAPSLIKGSQIRAGRALLRWSAQELADKCGLSYATIQRAESVDVMPAMTATNLMTLKSVLERAGVVFLDGGYSGEGGPGVRLRK